MTTYKLIKDPVFNNVTSVLNDSSYHVPFDPDNTDYQEYLEWAKTNTADPAD